MTEGLIRVNDAITYKVYPKSDAHKKYIWAEIEEEEARVLYPVGYSDTSRLNGLLNKVGSLPKIDFSSHFVIYRVDYSKLVKAS